MVVTPATRAVLRVAFAALAVALVASLWELAARQAPGTTFYLGMLPGPIASLRETAAVVGLVTLGAAWLVPAAGGGSKPRGLVAGLTLGVTCALGTCAYAASRGMYGVQLGDVHPAALPVFALKHGGLALWAGCVAELFRRALFGRGC